ncbi:Chloroperoxidase [Drechslerella dactyloides]|uniref:Chloroperoxidase n=1 Tax=Drechslerella dactyloides TaxID=74499 RepID=A0AAD6IVC3_DREDA|nr:Chloroperoxidase [Drechslerella dactyloides]
MDHDIKIGEWRQAEMTDLRSPCPVVNALANHGYIPRDGRNVTSAHFLRAFQDVLGLAPDTAHGLTKPAFLLHLGQPPPPPTADDAPQPHSSSWFPFFNRLPGLPTMDTEFNLGLRDAGQVNDAGVPVLNLDQLSRHGAVEHDVSLTRNDFAQGDNTSPQPFLLDQLFAAASDGKLVTIADFARLRHTRLEQQKRDNPDLKFGVREAILAFGEAALILCVWGASRAGGYDKIPVEYLKALFGQERLPFDEGWQRRTIPVTLAEVTANSTYLQGLTLFESYRS